MQQLIGREAELQQFNNIRQRDSSSFVAVYGRRRVGKTFLIRTAFNNEFSFYATGVANVGMRRQLGGFYSSLTKVHPKGHELPFPKDWFEAFDQLAEYLSGLSTRQKVIFLDELPWFDTAKSSFVPALEYFWNSWASARHDILLIVCGSAASWMMSNLINHHGGLHNRVTHRIRLEPFTLRECELYFQRRGAALERYQLVQLYMVFGGIPFYLEQIENGKSAAQNINDLCFAADGFLRTEFDNLYKSLFKKADKHLLVVETLSQKGMGMSREELIRLSKLPEGGNTTKVLKELEESGFIRKYRSFDKKGRDSIFQLTDFYSLFYLKFIQHTNPMDKNIWLNSLDLPVYKTWSGYAFEQVCLYHLDQIKKALGITGVQTSSSAWMGVHEGQKAQIDLVIDRRDQVVNLCEMKFSVQPFVIDKKYADDLRKKISVFKASTGTRKAIFLTFITAAGLLRNEHANALVQNDLTMDVLFD